MASTKTPARHRSRKTMIAVMNRPPDGMKPSLGRRNSFVSGVAKADVYVNSGTAAEAILKADPPRLSVQ
jgi:hypothetical protein